MEGPYSIASDLVGYAFWGATTLSFFGFGWVFLSGLSFCIGIIL